MISISTSKPSCYFYQDNKCILHRCNCFFCSSFTKRISGMTEVYQYVNLISTRRMATRSLFISCVSLIVSFLVFILTFIKILLELRN